MIKKYQEFVDKGKINENGTQPYINLNPFKSWLDYEVDNSPHGQGEENERCSDKKTAVEFIKSQIENWIEFYSEEESMKREERNHIRKTVFQEAVGFFRSEGFINSSIIGAMVMQGF